MSEPDPTTPDTLTAAAEPIMPGDLDAAIRARLLADAFATFKSGNVPQHYANCTVRYAGALKAVLDECDKAAASLSGDPDDWSLTPDDVRRILARELGVASAVERGGQP